MKYNREMLTLEAIGIVMVVAGHVENTFLDFGGALPYYNFHMPLFVFISGYFFRQPVGGGERTVACAQNKKAPGAILSDSYWL